MACEIAAPHRQSGKKLKCQKSRKLRTLSEHLEEDVLSRFLSRIEDFRFRDQMKRFTNDYFPEIEDIVTLTNLSESILSFNNSLCFNNFTILNDEGNLESGEGEAKIAEESMTDRLEGKFVSKNVVNLSKRELSESEISLLSRGLKFIPTPNSINKAKIKENLEAFGRKLRLK